MTRVLLDCDGVLADFVEGFLGLVEDYTGRKYKHEDITEFHIEKALGLSEEDARAIFDMVGRGFAAYLRPLPGAVEAVKRLREIAEVYIVTSPWNSCNTWMSERERWLRVHLDIPHSHVLHGSAKHLVCGDFLVDDKTENCITWQGHHPRSKAVLWKAPWNANDEWGGHHMNDWDQLIELVGA